MTTYSKNQEESLTIRVVNADCLEALKGLDDCSVDAVITDPPYGLSNMKPQQVADVLAAWVTGDTVSVPAKRGGFMGADWDSFVPPPAVWQECLRVLKPGGHMAVFAGARTQDLMGLSIRLAGFEIREGMGWIFGSGFPKSMDIAKAIDRSNGENRNRQFEFTEWMRSTGITAREIDEATSTHMGNHYTTHPTQPAIATADMFDKLRPLLPEVPERIERLVAERTGIEWTDYVKREVVGVRTTGIGTGKGGTAFIGDSDNRDITAPATSDAARWSGWGTALKPAIEPIILARKPFKGTVANNVLAHGVGGLNIDASRVESGTDYHDLNVRQGGTKINGGSYNSGVGDVRSTVFKPAAGRFPANVLLDEHAAAEMDEQSGASRFFPVFKYQAKAPKRERPVIEREDGTKIQHPTVKPLELLSWLVTLITPPGGVVLDPFAGTGTTMQAAAQKGFNSIGIEQSAEYVELINQRLADAGLTTKETRP